MRVKLEKVYLMNVALYLETKYDTYKFIQINKKCNLAVCELKITPSLFEKFSTEWFFKHFSPETIDRQNNISFLKCFDFEAPVIRNPSYNIDDIKEPSKVIYLFPKITHLSFENYDDSFEKYKIIIH